MSKSGILDALRNEEQSLRRQLVAIQRAIEAIEGNAPPVAGRGTKQARKVVAKRKRAMTEDDQQCRLVGDRREQRLISMTSTIEASSTTSRPQSSGLSALRLKPPLRGSTSISRWMVRASNPVASLNRRAARPVGAHSTRSTPLAARMRRMASTIVVLPTPGPPVMTTALEANQ